MTKRLLKWLTIIFPVLFGVLLILVRDRLEGAATSWIIDLLTVLAIILGSVLFSSWVFKLVAQRESEIERRTSQLAALQDASLLLGSDLEITNVLDRVVNLAQNLVNARYGALGVLSDDGQSLDQFITSGVSTEVRRQIGAPPKGLGILGVVIHDGKPVRIDNLAEDPRRANFPPYHPPMRTFLGVPIRIKGKAIGNLYLTDKLPERGGDGALPIPFTDEDEQIVEMFAAQAAIAIENAQLYRKTQQLAILQERERFGMDLHDGIIQSIYAVGLMLEEAQHRLKYDPKAADVEIRKGLTGLNEVIRDIRNYILDLRPERFQGRDLKHGIDELVRDLKANSFLNVRLSDESVDISRLSPEETVEILHIVQEALTNIRKHAKAVHVDIEMIMEDGRFEARISDDGVGLEERVAESSRGNGIRNMKERAAMIGGELVVAPAATGTVVRLILPSLSGS
ncbi:MAG TPA: GAF domain-containing sensor histidine kinase [Anaerolineales bacterium]|nr:GAF domain-containing sensor histidine kinase [Anaerolineales bacterium]